MTQKVKNIRAERPNDAFKRLGIGKSWGWKLVKEGKLPQPFRLIPGGRAVAFYAHEIDEYLENCRNIGGEHDGK
jgi:predicted DNA-binding transcriptional regulator AlpA